MSLKSPSGRMKLFYKSKFALICKLPHKIAINGECYEDKKEKLRKNGPNNEHTFTAVDAFNKTEHAKKNSYFWDAYAVPFMLKFANSVTESIFDSFPTDEVIQNWVEALVKTGKIKLPLHASRTHVYTTCETIIKQLQGTRDQFKSDMRSLLSPRVASSTKTNKEHLIESFVHKVATKQPSDRAITLKKCPETFRQKVKTYLGEYVPKRKYDELQSKYDQKSAEYDELSAKYEQLQKQCDYQQNEVTTNEKKTEEVVAIDSHIDIEELIRARNCKDHLLDLMPCDTAICPKCCRKMEWSTFQRSFEASLPNCDLETCETKGLMASFYCAECDFDMCRDHLSNYLVQIIEEYITRPQMHALPAVILRFFKEAKLNHKITAQNITSITTSPIRKDLSAYIAFVISHNYSLYFIEADGQCCYRSALVTTKKYCKYGKKEIDEFKVKLIRFIQENKSKLLQIGFRQRIIDETLRDIAEGLWGSHDVIATATMLASGCFIQVISYERRESVIGKMRILFPYVSKEDRVQIKASQIKTNIWILYRNDNNGISGIESGKHYDVIACGGAHKSIRMMTEILQKNKVGKHVL